MEYRVDLYKEEILEHYRNPRNHGVLRKTNAGATVANPLCGDRLSMTLLIEKKDKDEVISDVAFENDGCAISCAAASMLTEQIKGRKLSEVLDMRDEDIIKIIGMKLMPNRTKCALLSLEVFKKAVLNWREKKSYGPKIYGKNK